MEIITVKDQMGNQVEIPYPPQRIVSLVPSQTELLHFLEIDNEVIGITRYCTRPANWQATKTIVGGTKNFDVEKISSLEPDLIIGNKEENYKSGIDWLSERFPVWMSDIVTIPDALEMIRGVGMICQRANSANELVGRIEISLASVQPVTTRSAVYLIWRKPWMAAGRETFIDEMLRLNGLRNLCEGRYPELSREALMQLNPEIILLSSEPYPFQEKHLEEIRSILPKAQIMLVDGEMFSWYGSRLLYAADYFKTLKF
jgi:ABC-type Fe3+-hydroxamate transport system substrate-binding protein